MKVAIIGLSQSGKTTLFKALSRGQMAKEKGGLAIASLALPDERVDTLGKIFVTARKVYPALELVEVRMPAKEKSDGLDPATLNTVRPADAFIIVVRAFDEGRPKEDLAKVIFDLIVSDLAVIENRIQRLEADKKKGKDVKKEELEALFLAKAWLEGERLLFMEDPRVRSELVHLTLLTAKPMVVVVNIGEEMLGKTEKEVLSSFSLPAYGLETHAVCALMEKEIAELDESEQETFRKTYGLEGNLLKSMRDSLFRVLNLICFLTMGDDEVRAWLIPKGTTAVKAAGCVHSDMEKGFIRAEVIHYDDFIAIGSEVEAKRLGKIRLEGKEYIVNDGDIMTFRFNV
jgi:GTP-binding protein YchF